jgi:hydrogenase maturation protease
MPSVFNDNMSNRTLILGLGNSILRDDRIGLDVARLVYDALKLPGADLIECPLVGADMLNLLTGYRTVIIIDAIKTENGKAGHVYQFGLEDLPAQRRTNLPHNTGLYWTILMGRKLGMELPGEIRI